ncbi:MAG: hypothetical protein KatS3mg034_0807 [Vicingaceae bacterium]|nr:MAG: hypothetical protein KatS3mg034_0807 [Vicingaceae bacterium]
MLEIFVIVFLFSVIIWAAIKLNSSSSAKDAHKKNDYLDDDFEGYRDIFI